jgi:hypothetical protein
VTRAWRVVETIGNHVPQIFVCRDDDSWLVIGMHPIMQETVDNSISVNPSTDPWGQRCLGRIIRQRLDEESALRVAGVGVTDQSVDVGRKRREMIDLIVGAPRQCISEHIEPTGLVLNSKVVFRKE